MAALTDFTADPRGIANYDGAVEKIRVSHGGLPYMLKFGEPQSRDPRNPLKASYHNTPVSE